MPRTLILAGDSMFFGLSVCLSVAARPYIHLKEWKYINPLKDIDVNWLHLAILV